MSAAQTPAEGKLVERLRRLRVLSERATPGAAYICGLPWFQDGSGVMVGSPDPHAGYMIADTEAWSGEREEARENGHPDLADADDDALFLAECWNLVRDLLATDAFERLSAELERVRGERDGAQSACAAWQMVFQGIEAHLLDRIAMRDPASPGTYLDIIRADVERVDRDSQSIVNARWADYRRLTAQVEAAETLAEQRRMALEDEREACARIAEGRYPDDETAYSFFRGGLRYISDGLAIADAIRARSLSNGGEPDA